MNIDIDDDKKTTRGENNDKYIYIYIYIYILKKHLNPKEINLIKRTQRKEKHPAVEIRI